jgi:AraC-like DNA-binding protein
VGRAGLEQTRHAPPARGILRRGSPKGWIDRDRIVPSEPLAPFVHHFWSVRWDLQVPFATEALPHPSAVLTFEGGGRGPRARVVGVRTGRLSKTLRGKGRIFGITFRPAAFQPLLRAPMSTITDRVVPLARVLGSEGAAWVLDLASVADTSDQIAIAEGFLLRHLPPLGGEAERVRDMVERLARDQSLLRVQQVADDLGLEVRSLERRFRRYVGVSPKWVIRRYRLHEALERLRAPHPPALATLAADLGYADQAHFARDFRLVVGRTPRVFRG